ncbi:dipeptide ABC transporter ATP-binding protein [Shinella sumterensis]|uniref:dipeptide ABC transporter ATP-binding protein n=1 Tax=Shinella sumterensis TaxID=1967501 RepID=UPI003F861D11
MTHDNRDEPLLAVSNLTLKLRAPAGGSGATILQDVSITLRRGEVLGLIGESGAGKSTLGNAILGLSTTNFEQTSGSIVFDGVSLDSMDVHQMAAVRGRRIAAIFQDHTASLDPLMGIGLQVEEAIHANAGTKLNRRKARDIAVELLTQVGISEASERYHCYPHQFSGGQRQRIVIAIALAGSPDMIIADEPTSALDATVQKQILVLLRELVEKTGVSILLVTHDMGVVSAITDRVVVMRHGKVIEQGDTKSVLDAPERTYTRSLLAAVPRLRLSTAEKSAASSQGFPDSTGSPGEVALPDSPPILAAQAIGKTFSAGGVAWFRRSAAKMALRDVSVVMVRGEITGIVGESGSGKSTIGRIFAGLETASSGTLRVDGDHFEIEKPGHRSGLLGKIQMIFQDPALSLNPRMTIGETLRESVRFARRHVDAGKDDVGAMMDRLKMPRTLLTRYPHQLSGGQKQRACIARALLAQPRIMVADEPTSALDVSVQAEIVSLLREVVIEQGISMLFISHDLALVQALCSSIYIFKDGKVEDAGPSDFIFGLSQNPYTRSLIDARPPRFVQ